MTPDKPINQRKYPEVYERLIPIALGIIAVTIISILIVVFAIVFGFLPGVNY